MVLQMKFRRIRRIVTHSTLMFVGTARGARRQNDDYELDISIKHKSDMHTHIGTARGARRPEIFTNYE
mgnify:CR=1 FL=1